MIVRPNILVIGAAGRNVGKTEFACQVIARYASAHTVVGIKITTIRDRDGACPRGGQGCGECGSLNGEYLVTRETAGDNDKDTTRMLHAGAAAVYWLRVRREFLHEGVSRLLQEIPADALVVCESNSVRSVLVPGVFLVIREKNSTATKESCQSVITHADRILSFDGKDWDTQPGDVTYLAGRWVLRQDAAAIILAGGQSQRMGQDKSMLPTPNGPLIAHITDQLRPQFREILIAANDSQKYAFLGLPVVPDQIPGQGPLMGILSALEASSHDLNFITGCDIPHMDVAFIRQLLHEASDCDLVMPRSGEGRYEPLFAVYRKSVCGPAREILTGGGRKIAMLLDRVRSRIIPMPDAPWYRNLNTQEEYAQWVEAGTI